MTRIKRKVILVVTIFMAFTGEANADGGIFGRCLNLITGRALQRMQPAEKFEPTKFAPASMSERELLDRVSEKIPEVPEFLHIRDMAEKMGIRVWLFGGTAAGFLHYVKWDLARAKGTLRLQSDRFDYDYTNIYRSTQDLDIVVDGPVAVARELQGMLASKYPHFLGSKASKWEVRTLRHRMGSPGEFGFKEALLNDPDFSDQNTDSNSVGMVELTLSKDPVVRDLRHWDQTESVFLADALNNQISYFRSDRHFKTARAKAGENPEILSVLRLLVKAFQYELSFSENEFKQIKGIVSRFIPFTVVNSTAKRRIEETAAKLIMHAVNIEYAVNMLDSLGLRQKLIKMGNPKEVGSSAWWLSREPLRSKSVGTGFGRTAQNAKLDVVAHETNNFLAYESIARAHSGEPNVLISRDGYPGEVAFHGDGFYTQKGRNGARGTGLTIRFKVNPLAREGTDFEIVGDYVIFRNKRALTVIQESISLSLDDVVSMREGGQQFNFDSSDRGIVEKLKRRMSPNRLIADLEFLFNSSSADDHAKLAKILTALVDTLSKVLSPDDQKMILKIVFERARQLALSQDEADQMKYISITGPLLRFELFDTGYERSNFVRNLERIVRGSGSFDLRKQAIFEIFLSSKDPSGYLNLQKYFPDHEVKMVVTEIRNWQKSLDPRKRQFSAILNLLWGEAIAQDMVQGVKELIDTPFFDLNYKNISQVSMLQLAAYYGSGNIINWLASHPDFNLNARNSAGYNEVEQLRLSGKSEVAELFARSGNVGSGIQVRERNENDLTAAYPNGTPIVGFVTIQPNSYLMRRIGYPKVFISISKKFEVMSVDVSQKIFATVFEMIKRNLRDKKYRKTEGYGWEAAPSQYKGEDLPVESVSQLSVQLWIQGLNELSLSDDPKVQRGLEVLFPGHLRGKRYGLPTEAQWELVVRLGGVAEGWHSFGHERGGVEQKEYAVSQRSWGRGTKPVGSMRPVFYNGNPIYDVHGNVEKWLRDRLHKWTDWDNFVDPVGPADGSYYKIYGGSWDNQHIDVIGSVRDGNFFARDPRVGFRLIREGD